MALQSTRVDAAAGPYADLSVLVVDDEPIVRTTIVDQLIGFGVRIVREAGDGEAALREIAFAMPDLILCDVNMRPMDGMAFLERLRSLEQMGAGSARFLFLTADSQLETVARAAELQVDGYLVKPVAPDALAKRLDALFRLPPSLLDLRRGVVWS